MNATTDESLVDRLARALLYEGYVLYPYRPSVKNQQRWTFGGVYPPGGEEPSFMRTQCLFTGREASLRITVRFLHLLERTGDGEPWQEAVERNIDLEPVNVQRLLLASPSTPSPCTQGEGRGGGSSVAPRTAPASLTHSFSFPSFHQEQNGVLRDQRAIAGQIELAALAVGDDLIQLTVTVRNQTPPAAGDALLSSLVSTHTILRIAGCGFVSLTDPPPRFASQAAACANVGAWPVLVGEEGETHTLLSSPIILPDYPQLAPESPGDLFDGTEIDEILTLRILALTDDEKRAAAATDDRVRQLLERTAVMAQDQLLSLHGVMRQARSDSPPPQPSPGVSGEGELGIRRSHWSARPRVGDRVRISPRKGGDAFDIALAGRTALVVSIEHDFENKTHVAVTIDDDPGNDLGRTGMPGHRFFFAPDEVEVVNS